jgi:hypothetical protein
MISVVSTIMSSSESTAPSKSLSKVSTCCFFHECLNFFIEPIDHGKHAIDFHSATFLCASQSASNRFIIM